jgi:integrase
MRSVAEDWGIIEVVPKVKLLRSMQPEVDFYDFPEWERLVAAAKELDARAYLSVLLAGEAGLRVGEIVALEWGDIDFTRGVLRVSRGEWQGHVTSPTSRSRQRCATCTYHHRQNETPSGCWNVAFVAPARHSRPKAVVQSKKPSSFSRVASGVYGIRRRRMAQF